MGDVGRSNVSKVNRAARRVSDGALVTLARGWDARRALLAEGRHPAVAWPTSGSPFGVTTRDRGRERGRPST